MIKYDYLIVGSGLFGATFACEATRAGKKCLVLEKRAHIGGNAYTEEVAGVTVHRYGAHIFHTDDPKIWKYITGFAKFFVFKHRPLANYEGEIYPLPFNMDTFCALWSDVKTAEQARARIEKERAGVPDRAENLEQRAISLVGRTVYEKLIKGYTEKQWGRPCSQLPPSIIGRIPVNFDFGGDYFGGEYQGVPIGGYTPIIRRMLSGCDVLTNCDFNESGRQYAEVSRKIVYTGAVDGYFGYRYGALGYRSLAFETEIINKPYFQEAAVVNYTSADVPFTRIIEHKRLSGEVGGVTVVTREYPEKWSVGDEPFYPVPTEENAALYKKYLGAADGKVVFGGRLGEYKYLDMDETISSALRLAECELK